MSSFIDDIRQGDTRVFELDYGVGVDITNWIFYFILKKNLEDTENILQVAHTAGDNALDDIENGLAHLTLESTDTAGLEPDKYFYAIKVNKGGSPNIIRTLLPPITDPKDKVAVIDGIEIQ